MVVMRSLQIELIFVKSHWYNSNQSHKVACITMLQLINWILTNLEKILQYLIISRYIIILRTLCIPKEFWTLFPVIF